MRAALDGGLGGSLAAAFASQFVLIASGVLVARALGVEGRGALAAIVLVPSVVSQLGTTGFPLALTYYIAAEVRDGPALLRSLRGVIAAQIAVLSIVQVGILWLLVHPGERTAMVAALPVMPALVLQQYGLAVLQGRRRFGAFNVLRVAPAATYTLALIALALRGHPSLLEVVVAWTATNVIVGAVLGWSAYRFAAAGRGEPAARRIRDLGRFGISAVLGSNSPAEILRVDQAVIAFTLSRSALGLYVVALAFTNLPRFISQSVGMVAYPRIAAAGQLAEARRLLRRYLALVLALVGLVVGLLEVSVTWLIPWFFGTSFTDAVTTSRILLVAAFLLAMRRVLTDVAQGLGHPVAGTMAELVNLAFVLPLIAFAAPRYGIEGAATALAVGACGSLVALAFTVRRRVASLELSGVRLGG